MESLTEMLAMQAKKITATILTGLCRTELGLGEKPRGVLRISRDGGMIGWGRK